MAFATVFNYLTGLSATSMKIHDYTCGCQEDSDVHPNPMDIVNFTEMYTKLS